MSVTSATDVGDRVTRAARPVLMAVMAEPCSDDRGCGAGYCRSSYRSTLERLAVNFPYVGVRLSRRLERRGRMRSAIARDERVRTESFLKSIHRSPCGLLIESKLQISRLTRVHFTIICSRIARRFLTRREDVSLPLEVVLVLRATSARHVGRRAEASRGPSSTFFDFSTTSLVSALPCQERGDVDAVAPFTMK